MFLFNTEMASVNVEIKGLQTINKPPKRCAFGLCCNGNNTVYIFGGYFGNDFGKNIFLNDLWKINMNNINTIPEWIQLKRTQYHEHNWPKKTEGITMEYYNGKLYVIGQQQKLWEYNIAQHCWNSKYVNPKVCNLNRFLHKTVIYKHYIVLYGGVTRGSFNDCMDLFDLIEYKWHKINIKNYMYRYNHGMTILNDKLYIFGGKDARENICNNMFYIDIKYIVDNIHNNCNAMCVEIDWKLNIYAHSIVGWNNNIIGVCGRFEQYPVIYNDCIITSNGKIIKSNYYNYPRFKQNHCLLNINNSNYIFIFGGHNINDSLNDIMLIKLIDENELIQQKSKKYQQLCSHINALNLHSTKQVKYIKKLKEYYDECVLKQKPSTLMENIESKCNEKALNKMDHNELSKLHDILINNAHIISNELRLRFENKTKCKICNINKLNGIILPCCHCGCFNCLKKLEICHVCHKQIQGIIQMK